MMFVRVTSHVLMGVVCDAAYELCCMSGLYLIGVLEMSHYFCHYGGRLDTTFSSFDVVESIGVLDICVNLLISKISM